MQLDCYKIIIVMYQQQYKEKYLGVFKVRLKIKTLLEIEKRTKFLYIPNNCSTLLTEV